jgi:nucleoside-diphosphate-sugar epimerase
MHLEHKISILGCGWLGLPLAISLVAKGWRVKGSTTNAAKLNTLTFNKIDPYLVQLADGSIISPQFLDSDVLLINIPPSLKKQPAQAYLNQMQVLTKQVELSPVKQVIFISSTSVYPDSNAEIADTDNIDRENVLYQSEQLFRESKNFTTTIIRFAGLIGPGRNPARFFAGKTNIANGQAPVNLIHLDDCIGIIETLLYQQNFGGTYHAAAPTHPSRTEFYTLAAQTAGLPLPGFIDELNQWKIIDPLKLQQALNYNFIHPDLLKALADADF